MAEHEKKTTSGTQDVEEIRRKKKSPEPMVEKLKAQAGEPNPYAAILETAMDEPSPEKHAALLGDPRFSHSVNNSQKARMVTELQGTYGNAYVQRVVNHIQAKRDEQLSGKEVPEDITQRIAAEKGSGQPLESGTRTEMEASFGKDFGDVRVHTDASADKLSRELGAKAFTTGRDIFFREGTYQPGSQAGKGLLSHELTHVVQQGEVSSSKGANGPLLDNTHSRYELEADKIASDLSLGMNRLKKDLSPVNWPMIQKQEPVSTGMAVATIIGVIGSTVTIAGAIAGAMAGGISIQEVRWPGIAKFPYNILEELPATAGLLKTDANKEITADCQVAFEKRLVFEDLNLVMQPWVVVHWGGEGQPFTFNMGIRLSMLSKASKNDGGNIKIINEINQDAVATSPRGRKMKFTGKTVRYFAEIDETLVDHWKQVFDIQLIPYALLFPDYFEPPWVRFRVGPKTPA